MREKFTTYENAKEQEARNKKKIVQLFIDQNRNK